MQIGVGLIGVGMSARPDPIAALRSTLLPGAAQMTLHPLALGYMYQDRAGTQPVTASGQLLGRVRDIGGGGYDAVAVSDAARGVVTFASGKWYLTLNGVNVHYQTAALAAPGVDGVQVFAAVRKLSDVTQVIAELGLDSSSWGGFYLTVEPTSTRYSFSARGARMAAGSDQANVTGFASPDSAVLTAIADINGGAANKLRRNGGAWATSVNTTFGGGNINPSGVLQLNFGARSAGQHYFSGYFCGILPIVRFSANPPTDAQIAAAETSLTRWLV